MQDEERVVLARIVMAHREHIITALIRAERTEEGDHLRRFRFDELQVDRSEHPMFVSGGSRSHGVCRRCTKEVHSPIWRAQSERTILPKCALARMCAKAASASANG